MRNEAQKAARRKYEASEKGKAAKRKHEETYKSNGKRALTEARRETKPVSEARKAARKRWAKRNKWYFTADRAHRRMLAKHPISNGDKVEVDGMYLFCSIFPEFEVDHIFPVKGKTVSGLHVARNLQVIPRAENRAKGNKFCPVVAHIGAA